MKCDVCKKKNKGRYKGVITDGNTMTVCYDCYYGSPKKGKSDSEKFDELQTPFWKLLGLKPKPKDLELERYLKHRGMSYGDWRRERDYGAKHPSAMPEFERHYNKYGTRNAPDPSLNKES